MVITYTGNSEMLICSPDKENLLLKEYFIEADRELEDYDREEHQETLQITPQLRTW